MQKKLKKTLAKRLVIVYINLRAQKMTVIWTRSFYGVRQKHFKNFKKVVDK